MNRNIHTLVLAASVAAASVVGRAAVAQTISDASATFNLSTFNEPIGPHQLGFSTCARNVANGHAICLGNYGFNNASGRPASFGRACFIIDGPFQQIRSTGNTAIIERNVYVVDNATGAQAKLSVFLKTDQVKDSTLYATSVTKTMDLPLPFAGDSTAHCFGGANKNFVWVGASNSPFVAQINQTDFTVSSYTISSPSRNTTAIMPDAYGNVTVTAGKSSQTFDINGKSPYGTDGRPVYVSNPYSGVQIPTP